ncbi:hypothetical protein [Pseudoxanthomonas sp. UC19_8]|uniref:hypothetical protein n=1 Tax=Pseudoxanthomonas sp. UC19_8 TaxID=3350175 RepID=UPI0036D43F6B
MAALIEVSGGKEEVVSAIGELATFLAKAPISEIEKLVSRRQPERKRVSSREELESLRFEDIEGIVRDPETPRKLLEAIAVLRFGVPIGSMRSFSNISILREKLITLIENERAHTVIEAAARRGVD